jgi:hypothetical protein
MKEISMVYRTLSVLMFIPVFLPLIAMEKSKLLDFEDTVRAKEFYEKIRKEGVDEETALHQSKAYFSKLQEVSHTPEQREQMRRAIRQSNSHLAEKDAYEERERKLRDEWPQRWEIIEAIPPDTCQRCLNKVAERIGIIKDFPPIGKRDPELYSVACEFYAQLQDKLHGNEAYEDAVTLYYRLAKANHPFLNAFEIESVKNEIREQRPVFNKSLKARLEMRHAVFVSAYIAIVLGGIGLAIIYS